MVKLVFFFSFISPERNIFITGGAWCHWYLCKGSYRSDCLCVSSADDGSQDNLRDAETQN